jgi:hypothetical protein
VAYAHKHIHHCLCGFAGGSEDLGSNWGQIKIQEDHLVEGRNVKRNFALTPIALHPAITLPGAKKVTLRGKARAMARRPKAAALRLAFAVLEMREI